MTDELNSADLFALEWTTSFIDLNKILSGVRVRVTSVLQLLQDDLAKQIDQAGLEGATDSQRRRRTEKLIRDVRATLDHRFRQAEAKTESGLREVAAFASDEARRIIDLVFTVNIASPGLNRQDLNALIDEPIVLGSPAKDYWAGQSARTRLAFAGQMRLGVLSGETNQQLIARVRGRKTGRTVQIVTPSGKVRRVTQFSGGIMQTTRNQADALVRTSAQSIANNALWGTYQENQDILKGYKAVTTLDNRTSDICIARTGAAWDLEGNPLPGSSRQEPFPGPPPWHFRCRTILSPITLSWEEMVERNTGRKRRLLNTVPDSVRTSMDGLISNTRVQTFDDWLRIKGDEFARRKLGPGLFDLWTSGRITLSQLIDQAGNRRTLTELRAL